MHWLLKIDIAIFHFINGSLSNPFFDWAMPRMSGGDGVMRWFIPAALALVLSTICFGRSRARICAVMIFLVIALGDPLVVNTVKHLVHRPRPCCTLAHVIERLGCTQTGSMPSAHSANWFAMTMVMFLFYRRSLWFMLPMALTVSFSRVYNGVHYPSDVLTGMIMGAGYAAALVIAVETLWQGLGRKWFPVWYARMPLLAPGLKFLRAAPESPPPAVIQEAEAAADRQWLRLGYIATFVMLIAGWIYLASGILQLSQDEAYQWVWSRHLALSYYSKPLGIALIQFVGTSLFGNTEFGVRFFSPLFAAILSIMMLRFCAREISARAGFWLLLIVVATPLMAIGSVLMTIDPPLVLCWTWAMVAGWRAVQPDGQTRHWLVVGLAMGLAFLCKYTGVFQIVCWTLFFALAPQARVHLRRPGPWLALLIFLLCTLPVVIWNSQNGWITLNALGGDAGLHGRWHPTLRYFWDFLFSELALLNPIFFIGSLWALLAFWKQRRKRPLWLYLFCMGAPVFLGYWAYSFHSRILPNWIAVAVIPMFCLMVAYWGQHRRFIKPFFIIGLAVGFFAFAILHQTKLVGKITGRDLPAARDPLRRVEAWRQEAALVEAEREKLQQAGKPAFIICGHYGITGEYSFYIPQAKAAIQSPEPLVYFMDSDKPHNQFYFWPQYNYLKSRRGQNAIFVSEVNPYPMERGWFWRWLERRPLHYARIPPPLTAPPKLVRQFKSVTDLGKFDVKVGGRVLHRVNLWACYDLK